MKTDNPGNLSRCVVREFLKAASPSTRATARLPTLTVGLFLNPSYAASSVEGSSLAGGSSLARGLVNNAAYSLGRSESSLVVSSYSVWSGSVDSQTALIGSSSDSEDCEISPASPFVETSFSFDNSRHFPRRPPPAVPNKHRVSVYVNPNFVPKDVSYAELKSFSDTLYGSILKSIFLFLCKNL